LRNLRSAWRSFSWSHSANATARASRSYFGDGPPIPLLSLLVLGPAAVVSGPCLAEGRSSSSWLLFQKPAEETVNDLAAISTDPSHSSSMKRAKSVTGPERMVQAEPVENATLSATPCSTSHMAASSLVSFQPYAGLNHLAGGFRPHPFPVARLAAAGGCSIFRSRHLAPLAMMALDPGRSRGAGARFFRGPSGGRQAYGSGPWPGSAARPPPGPALLGLQAARPRHGGPERWAGCLPVYCRADRGEPWRRCCRAWARHLMQDICRACGASQLGLAADPGGLNRGHSRRVLRLHRWPYISGLDGCDGRRGR
jgi:hypothetical protein